MHTRTDYPRTRQFLAFCGNTLFVAACVGVLVYQLLLAAAHQEQIDEARTPDACRARPALCDMAK